MADIPFINARIARLTSLLQSGLCIGLQWGARRSQTRLAPHFWKESSAHAPGISPLCARRHGGPIGRRQCNFRSCA
ncbi:hypothetical protein MESS2_990004 [Mesorhizobium metallidurans STM 2683]|uniref:Uncharacterized protein n=4 Tax=Mesorhizobium TaxID=68287 RepID=A0A1R3V7P8_9HYPH|nr:conserved hypothetical protein [Mesorhizobium ventifaucium]CAH2399223.1 conserved hypothetical protein [Mesorhizobium escarrei]CCV09365.1 hypothetical protein MESS2_990004 [Mesorhizobium metallidurans STM 2683]SIT55926.1 conserved hypothetical protein [Mesorhizobium prunaredense]